MEKHQREGSPYGGKNDRAASESPEQKVSFADFRRQKARDQVFCLFHPTIGYQLVSQKKILSWNLTWLSTFFVVPLKCDQHHL